MKATTLLERQHRKVKGIFKKLESGRSDPAPLIKELCDDLAGHMTIEQELFYPAIKHLDEQLVLESYEEHAIAELAIKRLRLADPQSEVFMARVTAAKELI